MKFFWRAIRMISKATVVTGAAAAIVLGVEVVILGLRTPHVALENDLTGHVIHKCCDPTKPPCRLLIFGDSVAGGVGCASNKQALAGCVARAISAASVTTVEYEVFGISGYTAHDMQKKLIPQLSKRPTFDCCVISVGVNHVLSLHHPTTYALQLTNMLLSLRKVLGPDCVIICNAMPPMGKFPPVSYLWPLCELVQIYAHTMGQVTKRVCQETQLAVCVEWEVDSDMFNAQTISKMMAPDGYHPASKACDLIAQPIAKIVASANKNNAREGPSPHPNFDRVLDRAAFNTVKYSFCAAECLPFWVADMCLPTAPCVQKALQSRMEHPSFGYTIQPQEMWARVSQWLKDRHSWKVNPSQFIFTSNLVSATVNSMRAFTARKDAVALLLPLYHPLQNAVTQSDRRLVTIDMELKHGQYMLDMDHIRTVFTKENVRMFIWCHPHNPSGRVWNRSEMTAIVNLAKECNIILLSDEIHSDLMLWGNKHIPLQIICDECSYENIVTMSSPGKTFNTAGLHTGFVVIQNVKLYQQYMSIVEPAALQFGSAITTPLLFSAYTQEGQEWVEHLIKYLEGNVRAVESFFQEKIPDIRVVRPNASFLVWLDCTDLNLNGDDGIESALVMFFKQKAKVHLSDGYSFGGNRHSQFQRLNVGCPRSILMEGLFRIEKAVVELKKTVHVAKMASASVLGVVGTTITDYTSSLSNTN